MLRANDGIVMAAIVGMRFHPAADLVPPCAARIGVRAAHFGTELLKRLVHLLENALHVADDWDIRRPVLADFSRIDIHMNHAGVTREGIELARHAVIEAGAEGD